MKKIIYVFLMAILFSCTPSQDPPKEVKAPIDALVANWRNNWNNHDSIGVRNMFLEDALLIENELICRNAEEFAAKWIHPNIRGVKNLETNKLQEWSTSERAGFTGTYSVEVIHDSIPEYPKGAFAVNWIKTQNGEWKITSAVIHAFNP
jgi:ketosteroid isomerase-like protein